MKKKKAIKLLKKIKESRTTFLAIIHEDTSGAIYARAVGSPTQRTTTEVGLLHTKMQDFLDDHEDKDEA